MINFTSSTALAARMNAYQSGGSARTAFDEGIQLIPTWNLLNPFDITSLEKNTYSVQPREQEVLGTVPVSVSCGSDFPLVNGNYTNDPVDYVPSAYRLGIQMCKKDCGPLDFEEKFQIAEKECGVSFGKVMERILWFGDSFNPGLTQTTGVELFNAAGTDYENLDTKDAISIANFLMMISQGNVDPFFYVGPVMRELIGWRAQSTTGDTCTEVWDCVLTTLARRLGETPEQVSARFLDITSFDYMTGIDPNAPTASYPVMMVIDKQFIRMGISDEELGFAIANGHDFAEVERVLNFTAPQVLKYGSLKFIINLVTQQKVADRTGTRYGPAGAPAITVPTPL